MTPLLEAAEFGDFFFALWGYEPFPWQRRLAEQVSNDRWPDRLGLPTASGKTACIDIAIFSLALQGDRSPDNRTAPRRIFFVVDRRIVVDAAFDRAAEIAERLREAKEGILHRVADRLRHVGGHDLPLGCERLRGGLRRSNAWARSPSQAAVITCTVDQIGSRLLFRSYDVSRHMAPLHAGLAGNDALILLDEAHCALPFMQTGGAVQRFRGAEWAESVPTTPFQLVVLSATLPGQEAARSLFTLGDEDRASEELQRRLQADKPAALKVASKAKTGKDPSAEEREKATGQLAETLVDQAMKVREHGCERIAVMVNRVATARAVHVRLEERVGDTADVVLMTGRMRPIDRDALADRWEPVLRVGASEVLDRPVFVAATQCLEVGADFDFDGLVTECAPLDALRQRFGRLNRLGRLHHARAVIVVRNDQKKSSEDDPVYGASLAATWKWLRQEAAEGVIDMGIDALEAALPAEAHERRELLEVLSAPYENAPVMLPAHVDRWVQTDPPPMPDPDPALFLHGPERGAPEVSVIWRSDLGAAGDGDNEERWIATVGLCSPTTIESLQVPMWALRRWMRQRGPGPEQELSDLEGQRHERSATRWPGQAPVLLWRGRDESLVTADPDAIRPNDVVVIPAAAGGHERFGHLPSRPDGGVVLDVGDEAYQRARGRAMLRLTPETMAEWPEAESLRVLQTWALKPSRYEEPGRANELDTLLMQVAEDPAVPQWFQDAARALRENRDVLAHPAGGLVLRGSRHLGIHSSEEHPFADSDDVYSTSTGPISLNDHLAGVEERVGDFAARCGITGGLLDDLRLAGRLHDVGKADERFQLLLHAGSEIDRARSNALLAKSETKPESYAAHRRIQSQIGLPDGFRHELVSVALAQSVPELLEQAHDSELVLHLIASHHGRCRPFAPVVVDVDPIEVVFPDQGHDMRAHSDTGLERLDSGVAERFWRLVRRYGWWGLAYLEAVLRLADHRQSEKEMVRTPSAIGAKA